MFQAVEGLIDFWFKASTQVRWFDSDPELDAALRDRVGPLHERAAAGELDALQDRPGGALALCLLLDQIPRHIFRGQPRAYATDARARAVAARALERGFERSLPPDYRQFLYLPLEHSEAVEDQRRSVALFEALGEPVLLHYAREHLRVVERFGRFPHRNAILGRESTPEEVAFLEQPGSAF